MPYVYAILGKPPGYTFDWLRIWGQVSQPNTPITVEVQGPSGYLKDWYTLASGVNGYFEDRPNDMGTNSILENGDRITVTTSEGPEIVLPIPTLTVQADPDTNIVTGHAPPLSQVIVVIEKSKTLTVTADAGGIYLADFSGLGGFGDILSGQVIWHSPEGYAVERQFYTIPGVQCPTVLKAPRSGATRFI